MHCVNGLSVSKPVSAWNRPLKTSFKDIFKRVGKACVDGCTGNWQGVAKEIIGAASSTIADETPEQMAWKLIYEALAEAIYNLTSEHEKHFSKLPDKNALDLIYLELDESLEKKELCLDRFFFENPENLEIVEDIRKVFEKWLVQGFSINPEKARLIAGNLPAYFVFALNNQWLLRRQKHELLKNTIETPFSKAIERKGAWIRSMDMLKRQVDEKHIEGLCSLRNIYVPLRAYCGKIAKKHQSVKQRGSSKLFVKKIVDLKTELETWLYEKKDDRNIRLLIGCPGSGKYQHF